MELTPTLILNLALLIVPPVTLVLVFWQWLARHIRWVVALTALCDVLLFWDELFYYESFGLFAVLILPPLLSCLYLYLQRPVSELHYHIQ